MNWSDRARNCSSCRQWTWNTGAGISTSFIPASRRCARRNTAFPFFASPVPAFHRPLPEMAMSSRKRVCPATAPFWSLNSVCRCADRCRRTDGSRHFVPWQRASYCLPIYSSRGKRNGQIFRSFRQAAPPPLRWNISNACVPPPCPRPADTPGPLSCAARRIR